MSPKLGIFIPKVGVHSPLTAPKASVAAHPSRGSGRASFSGFKGPVQFGTFGGVLMASAAGGAAGSEPVQPPPAAAADPWNAEGSRRAWRDTGLM